MRRREREEGGGLFERVREMVLQKNGKGSTLDSSKSINEEFR